jgi:O-antigen ligase
MTIQKNRFNKIYEWLFVISPWVILAGMLQYHFRSFLPCERLFTGLEFFDFVSVSDIFVGLIIIVFLLGILVKKVALQKRKLAIEWKIAIGLLMIAGILQLVFQKVYEPVLSTPFEYFRSLFIFPLIFVVLAWRTLDEKVIGQLVKSYLGMVSFFCLIALTQYFTGVFPGEQHDFMGRLVWPYIDFVTMKSQSANWVAFFVTPAVIFSFINVFETLRDKRWKKLVREENFWLYGMTLILSAVVLYMTQSYGGYAAVFAAAFLYMFRALPFKKFLLAILAMAVLAGGVYLHQQTTWKYQVLTDQVEYRFATSAASRADIYEMNLHIISEHPILGVGLNQYQSYFAQYQVEVLGEKLNESHIPPHGHNFFMHMWNSLGVAGFLAMLILVAGIFWRTKFDSRYAAVFVLVAIMTHGLIDSYYWKQEIAYVFWLVVMLSYMYKVSITRS